MISISGLIFSGLLGLWVFGGRGLLLMLIGRATPKLFDRESGLATGLLITPCLGAMAAAMSGGFILFIGLLIVFDLILIAILVTSIRPGLAPSWDYSPNSMLHLGFGLVCSVLALFNGPFIEHLTDAWWHMRHAGTLLNEDVLVSASTLDGADRMWETAFAFLGFDSSSYRLQASMAWLTGSSILESWYGSTIAVSGLIGVSFSLLAARVLSGSIVLIATLVVWLVVMGGMNTGVRLAGWPAGMGYVFLNLGLLATFRFWTAPDEAVRAALLLLLSIAGLAFFHFAEIYLLGLAILFLMLVRLAEIARGPFQMMGLLLMSLVGVSVVWWAGTRFGTPPSVAATVPVLIMLICLWLILVAWRTATIPIALLSSIILATIFFWIGIDWSHLKELFFPGTPSAVGYYDSYIPKYLVGFSDKLVRIPKWEHQLRASLLWSGVLAIPLTIWLHYYWRDRRSLWILCLTAGPVLMILSPPVFTMAVALVPPYGGYRVQFLMPVALAFGLALSTCISILFRTSDRTTRASRIGALLTIGIVAMTLAPDLATRLTLISDRPWAKHSNIGYHWRLVDNRYTIATHTSWRYQGDLAEIASMTQLEPGMFISDMATSYYVSAETGMEPLVQQAHHSGSAQYFNTLLQNFCTPDKQDFALFSEISKLNARARIRDRPELKYFVLNRDTTNYTAEVNGRSCVGEISHLKQEMNRVATLIYRGQFLSLWKLKVEN